MTVNVVLVNGKVIRGAKLEPFIKGVGAMVLAGFTKTGPLSVTLANLLWYRIVDAEVDGKRLKEILIPITSILYLYEE